jgi:hypothetical protein
LNAAFAALWLLGLLAAAPALRTGARYTLPDRLRDALILGVAIPFILGLVHALYPLACWLALAPCVAIAYRRRLPSPDIRSAVWPPYLLVAALALVAWPQLMRPLLDGDSLSYHLPNAAAWAHAHSLWTTDPLYWWYPPASELFASAIYVVAGPFAAGWSGAGALALLGFRIVAYAREECGAPPWLADALGAATVTALPIALQAATLQNDVWLAAFLLEALWALRCQPAIAPATLAVTALIKPYGFIFAFVAACAGKASWKAWVAAACAIGVWALHDAALWAHSVAVPAASHGYRLDSTIAAHGLPALAMLVRVAFAASPFAAIALFAALTGPLLGGARERALGWTAFAALIFFLVMPFAYADANPQLATGASLRYAAPAIALGALLLVRPVLAFARAATALLVLCALSGAWTVRAIILTDAPTRSALGVALACVAVAAAARALRSSWPLVAGLAVAVVASCFFVGRHPVDYFTQALSVGNRASGVYAWIARTQPAGVAGWGLRLGTVNTLDPRARTFDVTDASPCATARTQGALLVAVAQSDRTAAFNAQRLALARRCGTIRYDDGSAVVTSP